jgi:hypothetical protein
MTLSIIERVIVSAFIFAFYPFTAPADKPRIIRR